jgi:drug/metabolite transporter (DMT)-like permease
MENEDESLDLKGVMWMLASVVLFAGNTLLIRAASLASAGVDGWMATLFRGAVGVLLLQLFYTRGRGLEWRRMFSNRLVLMRGLIGGFAIICFYITIVKLGAGRAVVINLTYPMYATVIAAFWLKEKVRMATRVWLVVALAGLVVFLSDGNFSMTPSSSGRWRLAGWL